MMTCPAIVPTEEEDSPEASRATPKTTPAARTEQRLEGAVGLFEGAHVCPGSEEGGGRSDEHGGVDRAGDRHGNDHVNDLEAEEKLLLLRLVDDNASLGQGGVQEDGMRHDGCAQDAGGQQDAFGVGKVGTKVLWRTAPHSGLTEEEFDHITDGNDGEKSGDHRFQRAEAVSFQAEDQEGDDRGQQAGDPQRQAEEQVERHGRAQEFSQVGGHGNQFHQDPHDPHHRPGKVFPALLGQVLAAGDAQFGGQRLQEHGHQVADQDDPQQFVTELRPGLDVGGKVARVHVGDAGDEGRAEERQQLGQPAFFAFPGEHCVGIAGRRGGVEGGFGGWFF